MSSRKSIYKTQSLCPVCLKKIDAEILAEDQNYYLEKSCPEHGAFMTLVWKGSVPMEPWIIKKERAQIDTPLSEIRKGCPFDCGLCAEHRQHTCTALIEVTQNCNLHCSFCFADSSAGSKKDPSLEEIKHMYESVLKSSGTCNIQLSGGEPTVRDDLPSIIKTGIDLGFEFIQVNTNGIRLGEDEAFVKDLKTAGLSSIFLQFDGTDDLINKKLRGKELLQVKIKAIENCGKYGIGVVLVPTLVPKVNVESIGAIIDFALEHIHAVRGVHFQPVSYFGRTPTIPGDEDRITLPEVMDEIERQMGGRIKAESLRPPKCENSLCSFHGSFVYLGNGKLMSLANNSNHRGAVSSCGCQTEKAAEGAIKAKAYVSRNWSSRKPEIKEKNTDTDAGEDTETGDISGFDEFLSRIRNNSFSLSAMAFQDVWNVDLERVKDCCIHVVSPDGRLIPFCAYNITDIDGRSLYRG